MRIDEVRAGVALDPIVLDLDDGDAIPEGTFEVEFPIRGNGDRVLLAVDRRPYTVKRGADSPMVQSLIREGATTLSLATRSGDDQVVVDARRFDGLLRVGDLRIEVPDEVRSVLARHLGRSGSTLLEDEYLLLDADQRSRAFV